MADSDKDDWEEHEIDDWHDVPVSSSANPKQKQPLLNRIGQAIIKPVAAVSRAVDSVTGAPVRAGVGALQEGKGIGEALGAYGHQFAEDPSKAPSGKDIAAKLGLSTEDSLNTGLHLSPFPGDTLHISPAGL